MKAGIIGLDIFLDKALLCFAWPLVLVPLVPLVPLAPLRSVAIVASGSWFELSRCACVDVSLRTAQV